MSVWDILAIIALIGSVLMFAGTMDFGRKQTGVMVVATYFLFSGGVAMILL